MRGFVVVLVVGVLVAALLRSALQGQSWQQHAVLSYPFWMTWALWAFGYLMGIRRRAATLAVLARLSYRLRCIAVSARRRRRLAAAAGGDAA